MFVPLALPGERWRVRLAARRGEGFAAEPLVPLGRRAAPGAALPAFRRLRRLSAAASAGRRLCRLAAQASWSQALARRGLADVAVAAPWITPPASRRRVRLAFAVRSRKVRLGFRVRAGHAVVDVAACPVARPEIVALLPALRSLLADLALARDGRRSADHGERERPRSAADHGARARPRRARGAGRVRRASTISRASPGAPPRARAAEPIAARRPVRVGFAGVSVDAAARRLPAGDRLCRGRDPRVRSPQRSAMRAAVADLFAGCGTLGLPLAAAGRRVRAVDADADDAGGGRGARPARRGSASASRSRPAISSARRSPRAELNALDAVILDPPRAGARRPGGGARGVAGAADRDGVLPPRELRARRPHAWSTAAIGCSGCSRSTPSCGRARSSWSAPSSAPTRRRGALDLSAPALYIGAVRSARVPFV